MFTSCLEQDRLTLDSLPLPSSKHFLSTGYTLTHHMFEDQHLLSSDQISSHSLPSVASLFHLIGLLLGFIFQTSFVEQIIRKLFSKQNIFTTNLLLQKLNFFLASYGSLVTNWGLAHLSQTFLQYGLRLIYVYRV